VRELYYDAQIHEHQEGMCVCEYLRWQLMKALL